MLAGAGLVALALLAELIPGTEPGIGPLQVVLIAAGAGISLLAALGVRLRGTGLTMLLSLLLSLALGEGLVRLLGYAPNYTPDLIAAAQQPLRASELWVCSSQNGCRINPATSDVERNCEKVDSPLYRWCLVNAQGYRAQVDFTTENVPEDGYRVLLLGDSFTWGASALVGNSWGEVLEATLNQAQPVAVWNAAIPGTGTGQAVESARELVPVFRPDLVILGFYVNDFIESLYPLDNLWRSRDDNDAMIFVYSYDLQPDLTPFKLSDRDIYFRLQGRPAARSEIELLIGQSALGSLLVNAFYSVTRAPQAALEAESLRRTREFLAQLQQSVEEAGARFVILNIPAMRSYEGEPSAVNALRHLRQIAQELGIEVIEVYEALNTSHYQNANPDDEHWNDAGHGIAGRIVSEYVQKLIDDGKLGAP